MAKKSTGKAKSPSRKAAPAKKQAKKPVQPAAAKAAPVKTVAAKSGKAKPAPTVVAQPVPKNPSPAKAPRPVIRFRPPPPPPPVKEEPEPPVLTEAQLRKVKTDLSRKDLNHYRQLLLQKRAEIIGDVESLQVDTKNNGGNLSHMPVHMADVGSDNYEQEFTLGLVESERKLLREIDDALARMKKGYYGVCVERGVPIGRARLDAKPWAKYCIEVVRELEKRGLSG